MYLILTQVFNIKKIIDMQEKIIIKKDFLNLLKGDIITITAYNVMHLNDSV